MKYQRIPYKSKEGVEGFRYLKDAKLTKESRIPHDVMDKFSFTDSVEYELDPNARICLFCDAPQTKQRVLNSETVELCDWHYHNKTLGAIAAQVRLINEERPNDGSESQQKAKRKRKQQRKNSKVAAALNHTG